MLQISIPEKNFLKLWFIIKSTSIKNITNPWNQCRR